jgi:hypothetical protein
MRSLFVGLGLVALLGLSGCSTPCENQLYEIGPECRFYLDHGAPINNPACLELKNLYDNCPALQEQYPLLKKEE